MFEHKDKSYHYSRVVGHPVTQLAPKVKLDNLYKVFIFRRLKAIENFKLSTFKVVMAFARKWLHSGLIVCSYFSPIPIDQGLLL